MFRTDTVYTSILVDDLTLTLWSRYAQKRYGGHAIPAVRWLYTRLAEVAQWRVPATTSFPVNRLDERILSRSHDVHYFLLSEREREKKSCFLWIWQTAKNLLSQIHVLYINLVLSALASPAPSQESRSNPYELNFHRKNKLQALRNLVITASGSLKRMLMLMSDQGCKKVDQVQPWRHFLLPVAAKTHEPHKYEIWKRTSWSCRKWNSCTTRIPTFFSKLCVQRFILFMWSQLCCCVKDVSVVPAHSCRAMMSYTNLLMSGRPWYWKVRRKLPGVSCTNAPSR